MFTSWLSLYSNWGKWSPLDFQNSKNYWKSPTIHNTPRPLSSVSLQLVLVNLRTTHRETNARPLKHHGRYPGCRRVAGTIPTPGYQQERYGCTFHSHTDLNSLWFLWGKEDYAITWGILLIVLQIAEQSLRSFEPAPGFSLILLQIVASGQLGQNTRLAAALFFKNFIRRNWTVSSTFVFSLRL